ncbi:MAG: tRNA methyltransferase [Holosporales bacterium]|jgi:tRNA (cytidine/uridine-2'-O-)-methyltransferase|nr:tRNA methyltransferase [Holosporales bacterium]
MRLAFYHPEIPHNTGALLRVAACLNVQLDLISPLGFLMSDRHLRRASMDYEKSTFYSIHANFKAFMQCCTDVRIVALIAHGGTVYTSFPFLASDVLLLGPESTGLPEDILEPIPHRVTIPMQQGIRSLNAAIAGSIVLAEALRQRKMLPQTTQL